MKKKIVLSMLIILIITMIIIGGMMLLKKYQTNKLLSNIKDQNLTEEQLLDKSISEYAAKFTGDKVKINIETKEIDFAYSSKDLIKTSQDCIIGNNKDVCEKTTIELLTYVRNLAGSGYVLSENSYNALIEMLVTYGVSYKDLPKYIKATKVEDLSKYFQNNKTRVVEDRLKSYMDGSRKDIDDMICKDINIVDCNNMYYKDSSKQCESLKSKKEVKERCGI